MRKKIHLSSIVFAAIAVAVLVCSPFPAESKAKTLTFSSPVPEQSFVGQQQQWWADEVEKRTDGRIKIRFYWMGSLIEWKEAFQGVSAGMCDIATPCSTYNPSDFPLYMVLDMPYNGKDYWAAMMAANEAFENQPDLNAEMEKNGIKIIANWMSGHFYLGVSKPTKSLADLKGKAIRSYGGARVKWMEKIGINPVFMDYAAIYEAMDRGSLQGAEMVMVLSDAFKHQEVTSDLFIEKTGFVLTCATAINLKVWNSLSADIQKIILDLREDYAAHYAKELSTREAELIEKWKKEGVNVKELSAEDKEISRKAAREAQEYFLEKQESSGHPARAVWEYYTNARDKYEEIVKTKGHPWER